MDALSPCAPAWRLVAEAEHALGRLDEAAERLGARPGLVRSTRVRDAHGSAGLSGVAVGLREAFAADLLASQGPPPSDRSAPAQLLAPYVEAYHRAAPDPGRLDERLPRIAGIALAHHRLEVSPTGGGHAARVFSAREMVRRGLLRDHVLPLSVALDDASAEYRRQVRAAADTGRFHSWVEFFATIVRDQARAQLRLIAHLVALAADYARRLPRTGRLPLVAAELVGYPVVNHRGLRDRHGVSMKAATDLTRRLVGLGILVPWEFRGYRRVFVCRDVLRLLADHPDTTAPPERP